MNILKKISYKNIIISIAIIIVMLIGFELFSGKSSVLNHHRLSEDNKQLQTTIDSLKTVLKNKTSQIKMLKNDSNYMEYIIRTRLGMSKEGEQVFQFIDESKLK